MDEWLAQDPNYKKFVQYFGELRPFKDDDPKRLMRSIAMRKAYSTYSKHANKRSSGRQLMSTATGYNQALVKVIPRGGARSGQGLRDQVSYLTRQHSLKMSESTLALQTGELEQQELLEKVDEWAEDFHGNPKFGHTTHLVVSFPRGTNVLAAKKAGEEFADRALAQGLGGECFDHLTIQHTDTDFPHTHIIVRNRGLQENGWFTIRKGSAHEPSKLRELQAEVAAKHGIQLSATTRLERGIKEKPILTPEFRRAKAQNRAPRPEPLSPLENIVLDALIDDRADAYGDLAETLEDTHKELKQALKDASDLLKTGGFIVTKTMTKEFDGKSTDELIETLDAEKTELDRQLKDMSEKVKSIEDDTLRASFQAKLDVQKANASRHFPEREDYRIFARGDGIEAFREAYQFKTVTTLDTAQREAVETAYEKAERNVRSRSQDLGLDADEILARYKVTSTVRHETARRWHLEEQRDVSEKRPDLNADEARQEVTDFHAYVRDQFKAANRTIAAGLNAQGANVTPKETPLPAHALNPFDEIQPTPRLRPRPNDDLKHKPRPTV